MHTRFRMRTACSLVAAIALLGTTTLVASAHARFQSSIPAANGTVAAAPATVQATFTEELKTVSLTVTGPGGATVSTAPASINLQERKTATVPIRDAGPGTYVVAFHTLSAEDGEDFESTFMFTVGTATTSPAATTPATGPAAATGAAPVAACVEPRATVDAGMDARANTYCKRHAIREAHRGEIDELVFNDLIASGMALEIALQEAGEHTEHHH